MSDSESCLLGKLKGEKVKIVINFKGKERDSNKDCHNIVLIEKENFFRIC